MPLPLEKIRVCDLSRILAGPYCTMMLGDLGAEVIKVERPGLGDDTRQWGPPFAGGESAYYLCCNRNKKSITLNLKSEPGREIAIRLAVRSDILVENFLPGTAEYLGLGYEALREFHPGLIYCSITGFGQDGPNRDLPGYDLLIQGMGGIMSITGEPGGEPMKVGVAISDITAGLFATNAILAALLARERTGMGDRIDISLLDSTVAWLANVGSNYLVSGEIPRRYGNAHPNIVPYQAFRTADGYITLAVGNDAQWSRFCQALARPDLAADARFTTNPLRVQNREALLPLLQEILQTRPSAEWILRFLESGVPAGPVHTVDRVFLDPQVTARQMLLQAPHPTIGTLRMVGSPLKFSSSASPPLRPPPLLGQHTSEVLCDLLAFTPQEIEGFKKNGVI